MGRRPRRDGTGTWHHVMNRGIARRTVFETRADARQFLAGLAREVRAGRLEVHSFALLTTHFHVLVRSALGELAEAMRRIQNAYVRWFNRGRKRDGALFRGRFTSRAIEDDDHWDAVVGYIDRNPVEAGLAQTPESHPWGSAHHFAMDRIPRWLCRDGVEARLRILHRESAWSYARYAATFQGRRRDELVLGSGGRPAPRRQDERANLAAATPPVLDWMQRKALLADGTGIGAGPEAPDRVETAVVRARTVHGRWERPSRGPRGDGWRDAKIVLLHHLCGLSVQETALRCGAKRSTAYDALKRHDQRWGTDAEYTVRLSELIRTVSDTVRN